MQQPTQQAPALDITKLNIPALLMEKLQINEEQLSVLLEELSAAESPQDALMIIKQFDLNPETMNDPVPQEGAEQAPPTRGLPL